MINLACYTCRARCRPCSSVLTVLTGTAHCRSTVRLGIVIVVLPRRTILADRRCGSRVLAILALIAFSPRSAIRISVSSTAVCAGNLPSCRVLASYARCTRGSRAVGAVRSTSLSHRSSERSVRAVPCRYTVRATCGVASVRVASCLVSRSTCLRNSSSVPCIRTCARITAGNRAAPGVRTSCRVYCSTGLRCNAIFDGDNEHAFSISATSCSFTVRLPRSSFCVNVTANRGGSCDT